MIILLENFPTLILSKNLITNNMLNFETISKIFSDFLDGTPIVLESDARLSNLIRSNIEMNQKLWNLEDSARMIEFGLEHVAITKREIDKSNQTRNDLIGEIDVEIANQLRAVPLYSQEQSSGESPGIIIDRLAILYIKLSVIRDLLSVIKEEDLKKEYRDKENIILKQIDRISNFLNSYFKKLERKEAFFDVQQPVKIYNDERIKKYIKILKHGRKGPPSHYEEGCDTGREDSFKEIPQ